MAELAALSLFCNVLQVAEFALGIVSKGNEIYKAGIGADPANIALEKCSRQLMAKNAALEQSLADTAELPSEKRDDEDLALEYMARDCNNEAQKLIDRLSSIRVHGSNSRLDSIRSALKAVMKKDEINAVAERMKSYQDQLSRGMIQSIW